MKTHSHAHSTTEIKSAAIYRYTNKKTHEVFYVVRSDSVDEWYQLRFDSVRLCWQCSCPRFFQACKHKRAVQEVLAYRAKHAKRALSVLVPLPASASQPDYFQTSHLSSNQAFSLLR